jgi:hypothetical protein
MIFSSLTAISASWRSALRVAVVGTIAILAASCGTASIDDAVPGATRTGIYPNLNIPQHAATEQLSDEEAAAGIAAVSAARSGQQAVGSGTAASESEADRLRRLRESHGAAVLEEIEG